MEATGSSASALARLPLAAAPSTYQFDHLVRSIAPTCFIIQLIDLHIDPDLPLESLKKYSSPRHVQSDDPYLRGLGLVAPVLAALDGCFPGPQDSTDWFLCFQCFPS